MSRKYTSDKFNDYRATSCGQIHHIYQDGNNNWFIQFGSTVDRTDKTTAWEDPIACKVAKLHESAHYVFGNHRLNPI